MAKRDEDKFGSDEKSLHPMQPVVLSDSGVVRFQANDAVRLLLDESTNRGYGLNQLHVAMASNPRGNDHLQHLSQLIGYSVCGYSDLSTRNNRVLRRADKLADQLLEAHTARQAQIENKKVQDNLPPWED